MDPARLPSHTFVGKLLRLPLRLVPRQAVVRVLGGPAKGCRWVVGSSTHGCWIGSYETGKSERFAEAVTPGSVVYDVGANAGYYTLVAARRAGAGGTVIAFEPHPENARAIRRHCALNGLDRVRLVEAAVGSRGGTARFRCGPTLAMGSLGDEGELEVPVVSLDEQLARGELPPPTIVKMDIEGAEFQALCGARDVFKLHRPTLFLATHGAEVHARCCALLADLGYRLESLDDRPVESTAELLARPD